MYKRERPPGMGSVIDHQFCSVSRREVLVKSPSQQKVSSNRADIDHIWQADSAVVIQNRNCFLEIAAPNRVIVVFQSCNPLPRTSFLNAIRMCSPYPKCAAVVPLIR